MSFEVGASYRSKGGIADDTGSPIDPLSVILTVTLPDGTTATPTAVHDSAGNYHADYVFTQEGLHRFTWTTTNPVTVQTNYENAAVFRSVLSLREAKTFLDDEHMSDTKSGILRQVMTTATELAEEIRFGAVHDLLAFHPRGHVAFHRVGGQIRLVTFRNNHAPGKPRTSLIACPG